FRRKRRSRRRGLHASLSQDAHRLENHSGPHKLMLRHAMCNEAFGETPMPEVCRILRDAGYKGIEVAPFTLDAAPDKLSPQKRGEIGGAMGEAGLEFVGLHWLLAGPPGLHVTTPDEPVRKRSWEYLHRLVDLSGDLADGPSVMVFGSPKQ